MIYQGEGSRNETDSTGITTDDRKRIREYLDKPAHRREAEDLIPDEH